MELASPVSVSPRPEPLPPPVSARMSRLEMRVAALEVQVAQLRSERAALWWAVGHDELTGLANRRLFHARCSALLAARDRPAVVIVLDLNGFKPINDAWGHDTGDDVLRVVARRLATHLPKDVVARVGGDEFAAMLTCRQLGAPTQWWRPVVATLCATLAEPMTVAGQFLCVTASVGVAPVRRSSTVDELLRCADAAMYRAKVTGADVAWPSEPDSHDGVPRPARQARV